ncbi:MAG: hypothetical protein LBP38_08280 [Desulfovibrio sp.]|jgi:hypothetical protein|nr:hypothetical protein [Desulfovibrio sp.]
MTPVGACTQRQARQSPADAGQGSAGLRARLTARKHMPFYSGKPEKKQSQRRFRRGKKFTANFFDELSGSLREATQLSVVFFLKYGKF